MHMQVGMDDVERPASSGFHGDGEMTLFFETRIGSPEWSAISVSTRRADVVDPAAANKVTSWPIATSCSVRSWATLSHGP